MRVPLLDINRQHADIKEELTQVFADALSSSRFIKGPEMEALEKEFAQYSGTADAIACASGTDALILALQAIGLQRDELVITVPFTFFATAGAIVRAGGTPVFVDILPDTFNMDPDLLQEWLNNNCAITNRGVVHRKTGKKVAAIIPVHLFGQICNMDAILATASTWDLPVIEDAAQAAGAGWKDSRAGSLGIIGCFSFFPSKNLGALGDGGMLTTNDPELAVRLRSIREHGGKGYLHSEVGTNSRMDAIQAGFLRVKLRKLEEWHAGRRANAERYNKAFADISQIETPSIDPRALSIYNQYTLLAENRDELLSFLRARQIGCAVYYPLSLHLQECFADLGYSEGDFRISERSSERVISLPVFGELTKEEQDEVIAA
ncbi:MAG: DegT/DnrJ/EryC1/StrS family aminotransferase, partial [Candidatus Sabulitectum sp.]|nr:DegT/DnrJ/EryC1/StrS family aminotransferase [Candidatus Sabulitectum sp.]